MMTEEKRKQVAAQCRVVAHLAGVISAVHADKAKLFEAGYDGSIIDFVGQNTADLMEILGDVANGMDIVTEEDGWTSSIFEQAQQIWPQDKNGSQ